MIPPSRQPSAGRLWRLAEELEEVGLPKGGSEPFREMLLEEIDQVLRPTVHERRIAAADPRTRGRPGALGGGTQLDIARRSHQPSPRRAALPMDFRAGWSAARTATTSGWCSTGRRLREDLVVLSGALDATIVQRHPSGSVRVVGSFGVLRWIELAWHYEPPVSTWIGSVTAPPFVGERDVLEAMLEFAVHDLGSWGIGSLLVYRPGPEPGPTVEERLPTPPPLRIRTATHLAPLRHALAQVDGAAVFDVDGVLRQLGVRLVPSATAEQDVDALGGTRHTSGRRYSFDDPSATVVAVSADGPVSVLRNGAVLGRSPDGSDGP